MEKLPIARINRSNSDHAALLNRSVARRDPSGKLPKVRAAQSTTNISKNVLPKTFSKFTVRKPNRPALKPLCPEEAKPDETIQVPKTTKKFPMEKSLTMIEMSSPSKKQQQNQQLDQPCGTLSYSTTALAGQETTRLVSNTSKLVYETGFKLLLKCWRDKKRQIDRMNAQLSQKDNTSIKYRNQLHTIQSLYQNECRNHESARNEIKALKQKLESLKSNLLQEKKAHLDKVSELEGFVQIRDKLQSQLTHAEEELAKAIINWHSFEFKLKQKEESCLQLTSEKRELLKQIDNLEDNFKKFECDYEKSLSEHTKSNEIYDARLKQYRTQLDEAASKIESCEADCQLLKEWNVRLASELAQVKGAYHETYAFRVRRFFTNLPRKPGFYVQYLLYLLVRGTPLPRAPIERRKIHGMITVYPYASGL